MEFGLNSEILKHLFGWRVVLFVKTFNGSSLNSANHTGRVIFRFNSSRAQEYLTRMPFLTFMTNSTAEWMLGYLGIENLFAKIESSEPYLPPQLFPGKEN